MKRADFVDKTVSNALLSMKTPDFVDKVAAGLGRPKPLRPIVLNDFAGHHCASTTSD